MTWLICRIKYFWCNNIDVFDEINENVNVNLKKCEDFDVFNLQVVCCDVLKNVINNFENIIDVNENVLKNAFFYTFAKI